MMKRFMLALRFLTVYPFGGDENIDGNDLAASTVYYPIIGAMLGIILYWGLQLAQRAWPEILASALIVTLWVLLTGGLHLDGLMDTFDGLGVRGDRARRLEVMRDSRVGAFGVQAAVLGGFIKILAVSQLINRPAWMLGLILAPVAGRTALVALMATGRYAREGYGLGREFVERTSMVHLLLAVLLFLILGYAALSIAVFPLLIPQILLFFLLRYFFVQNFGGVTGDLLGAACELHELAFLLLLPIILR
ncbi:adenosylcobinamide-GDP ribazoletransferase [Dethiobacter alkaliphilus]|nr:adenosylcobinamide-GDP ribazoletransferase [Dethiobacter alkaliphilus]